MVLNLSVSVFAMILYKTKILYKLVARLISLKSLTWLGHFYVSDTSIELIYAILSEESERIFLDPFSYPISFSL